jgi:hypothetical protein
LEVQDGRKHHIHHCGDHLIAGRNRPHKLLI